MLEIYKSVKDERYYYSFIFSMKKKQEALKFDSQFNENKTLEGMVGERMLNFSALSNSEERCDAAKDQ